MTLPYDKIKSRVDRSDTVCMICGAINLQSVIDHCHEHGWTRGFLCIACNNRIARLDADLSTATARELFHRDNCPDCRSEGYQGVMKRTVFRRPSPTTQSVHPARRGVRTPQQRAQQATSITEVLRMLIPIHGTNVGVLTQLVEQYVGRAVKSDTVRRSRNRVLVEVNDGVPS